MTNKKYPPKSLPGLYETHQVAIDFPIEYCCMNCISHLWPELTVFLHFLILITQGFWGTELLVSSSSLSLPLSLIFPLDYCLSLQQWEPKSLCLLRGFHFSSAAFPNPSLLPSMFWALALTYSLCDFPSLLSCQFSTAVVKMFLQGNWNGMACERAIWGNLTFLHC